MVVHVELGFFLLPFKNTRFRKRDRVALADSRPTARDSDVRARLVRVAQPGEFELECDKLGLMSPLGIVCYCSSPS